MVFPTIAPIDGGFLYTYKISILNEVGESEILEDTDDLVIEEIKGLMREELTYVPGSVSSVPAILNLKSGDTMTPGDPDQIQISGKADELKWKYAADEVVLGGNETWDLTFQATVPVQIPAGEDTLVVELKLEEHVDKVNARLTGPTAIVTSVEAYRVTLVVGGVTHVCDLWTLPDIDAGNFQVLDFCDF